MPGHFDYIEIESKCPECGYKVTLIIGSASAPIICDGCSVVIDPIDFIEISHVIHDLLHKTVPGVTDIPDELLGGAPKEKKAD